jgi:hypothetical protein
MLTLPASLIGIPEILINNINSYNDLRDLLIDEGGVRENVITAINANSMCLLGMSIAALSSIGKEAVDSIEYVDEKYQEFNDERDWLIGLCNNFKREELSEDDKHVVEKYFKNIQGKDTNGKEIFPKLTKTPAADYEDIVNDENVIANVPEGENAALYRYARYGLFSVSLVSAGMAGGLIKSGMDQATKEAVAQGITLTAAETIKAGIKEAAIPGVVSLTTGGAAICLKPSEN